MVVDTKTSFSVFSVLLELRTGRISSANALVRGSCHSYSTPRVLFVLSWLLGTGQIRERSAFAPHATGDGLPLADAARSLRVDLG